MKTLILSKKGEKYLHKTAIENKFTFGIVIGQKAADEKLYVVHLAKLSEDDESVMNSSQNNLDSPFENINAQSLADQWISASKMTPGSFNVIGIFIANADNDPNDEQHSKHVKNMLFELHNLVTNNNSTFGYAEHTHNLDVILLSYLSRSLYTNCKVFSKSSSTGNLMPADCKIVDKLPQYYLIESNYELDDVFPITDNREQVNIENQFNAVLQAVKLNIHNSEIFIDHQNVNENTSLESYLKENYKKNDMPVLKASILLTANLANEFLIKIRQFSGTIRFSGIVSSRIWCHGKATFAEIKNDVRKDVLRSLAARIQIYCDGLTDLHSNNVGVVISEPPRRIYFCYPEKSGIQFSEYIFRGETPSVAVVQAKQILDMDIDSDCIFDDLEGLPDDEPNLLSDDTSNVHKKANTGTEISRAMYMLGIAAALLVLLISVLLHYLFL